MDLVAQDVASVWNAVTVIVMNAIPDRVMTASGKYVHTAIGVVYVILNVDVVHVKSLGVPVENAADVVRAPFRVAEDPVYVATVQVVMGIFVKTVAGAMEPIVQKDPAAAVTPDPADVTA